jgi:ribonuclease HII
MTTTPASYMHESTDRVEIGLDEAGRGPCFGRLYTAAVIWPRDIDSKAAPLIRDSKTLKPTQIEEAFEFVKQHALEWHYTYADREEVEQYGPLKADMRSLHRCLDLFTTEFNFILMDGNYFKPDYTLNGSTIEHQTVVSGDANYLSIAAASIVAKYHRDLYILDLCKQYPVLDTRYDLGKNKGYLTPKHKSGIEEHGISEFHRRSYKCCKDRHINRITEPRIKPIITKKKNG